MDDLKITINIGPDAVKKYFKRLSRPGKIVRFAILLIMLSSVIGYSLTKNLERTHVFSDGDVILASEINKNFDDLFAAVNELLGNTPNVGIEWFKEQLNLQRTAISAEIDINSSRFSDLEDDMEPIPNEIIMIWSKPWSTNTDDNPSGWSLCDGSSVDIIDMQGYFVYGATGPTLPAAIENNTHTHGMCHTHRNMFMGGNEGGHRHGIFKAWRVVPEDEYGLSKSWNWEIYYDGQSSSVKLGTSSLWSSEYGYSLNSGSYITFGFHMSNLSTIFPTIQPRQFYTDTDGAHNHDFLIENSRCTNISETNVCANDEDTAVQSGEGENTPPYHALNFIKKTN
jgi:hypothetical protein